MRWRGRAAGSGEAGDGGVDGLGVPHLLPQPLSSPVCGGCPLGDDALDALLLQHLEPSGPVSRSSVAGTAWIGGATCSRSSSISWRLSV